MEYLPGNVGQAYLDNKDLVKMRDIYRRLGFHLVTDIHNIHMDDSVPLPVYDLVHPNIDTIVPVELIDEARSVLGVDFLTTYSLVHGDYGPNNIILHQSNIKIVDWEFAGWGSPLFDIAWVIWFAHHHYPNYGKELSEIFLKEYRTHAGITINKTLIKAFAVSRVIYILGRISETNVEGLAEWRKRLAWTLKADFID
jgi:hypothetical protein